MCYFTKKILNRRFLPNKKNHGRPPVCPDERFREVEIECGYCFECRKKKRNEWRIRNYEQLKDTPTAVFFTGTVSPERYEYIKNKYNLDNDNAIITKIHRLFLERIRKEYGKSIKHWSVTEKGHTNTRRIHLHGLYYSDCLTKWQLIKLLRNNWIDGYCYNGKYVNTRTINYVSKYMTKRDEDNKEYTAKVLCSPGLGAGYAERMKSRYKWNKEKTKEDYVINDGRHVALPKYYKYKFFTEDERQLLWMYREDSGIKYVGNFKITIQNDDDKEYYETLRKQHNKDGIATHNDNWNEIQKKKDINKIEKGMKKLAEEKRQWERYYNKYKDAINLRETLYKYKVKERERAEKRLEKDIEKYKYMQSILEGV